MSQNHGKDRVSSSTRSAIKADEHVSATATILDRILAGQLTITQVADLIMDDAYAGLRSFCDIPVGYHHCQLGDISINIEALGIDDLEELLAAPPPKIVNPEPVHLRTIEFFRMILEGDSLVCRNRSPLRPIAGASLLGPPGAGKTHIMAAFGLSLKKVLEEKLEEYRRMIAAFVAQEYRLFQKAAATGKGDVFEKKVTWVIEGNPQGSVQENVVDPVGRFSNRLDELRHALRKLPVQPTDLLYLGFEQLCQLYEDAEGGKTAAQKAIEQAAVVFIDDVHPQQDKLRFNVVQRLVERRYELGLHGTFITTNLSTEELGGEDPKVAKRLVSRLGESFMQFDFVDCQDWRLKVKARRLELIGRRIDERLAGRLPKNSEQTGENGQ
jgi:hypothetical protein